MSAKGAAASDAYRICPADGSTTKCTVSRAPSVAARAGTRAQAAKAVASPGWAAPAIGVTVVSKARDLEP